MSFVSSMGGVMYDCHAHHNWSHSWLSSNLGSSGCSQVASVSVAGMGSQFSQLQGAKPANHIIDCELHLMSCKRDVTRTFRVLHSPLNTIYSWQQPTTARVEVYTTYLDEAGVNTSYVIYEPQRCPSSQQFPARYCRIDQSADDRRRSRRLMTLA